MKSAEEIAKKYGGKLDPNAVAAKYGGVSDSQPAAEPSASLAESRQAASTGAFEDVNRQSTVGSRTREALINVLQPFDLHNVPGLVNALGSTFRDVNADAMNVRDLEGLNAQGQQNASGAASGLAMAPIQPVIDVVQGARTGDYDRMAGGAGGVLSQTVPAVAGGVEAIKAGVNRIPGIPTAAKAGAKFEQVMSKAKDVPVNTAAADEALARAQELRQRGSTMPKVMNDYAKRRKPVTADFGGQSVEMAAEPMTYQEGRDFASNAGAMSTRETTALNAKMQAQVKQFARAMKDANRGAAKEVGMESLYDRAMTEYRVAKNIEEKMAIVKKWAWRAGAGYAGVKLAKEWFE